MKIGVPRKYDFQAMSLKSIPTVPLPSIRKTDAYAFPSLCTTVFVIPGNAAWHTLLFRSTTSRLIWISSTGNRGPDPGWCKGEDAPSILHANVCTSSRKPYDVGDPFIAITKLRRKGQMKKDKCLLYMTSFAISLHVYYALGFRAECANALQRSANKQNGRKYVSNSILLPRRPKKLMDIYPAYWRVIYID